jgi:hypothetical protein
MRSVHKNNRTLAPAAQRWIEQPKFAHACLLDKHIHERRERPASARQFARQCGKSGVDDSTASAGELGGTPQRRMYGFCGQGHERHPLLYIYTVSYVEADCQRADMDTRVRKPPSHPMPEVAAFVRSLRDAFGDDAIDEAIRQGKSGEPTFYACENGRSVGTAAPSGISWKVDDSLRDRHYCPGCDGSCVADGIICSVWCKQMKLERR